LLQNSFSQKTQQVYKPAVFSLSPTKAENLHRIPKGKVLKQAQPAVGHISNQKNR